VTAHFGVWEILPTAVAIEFDLPISVVGRELDSKLMQKYLKKNREQFNVELINKKGALKGMIKSMNKGRTIGLLIDQSIPASLSVDVELFGKKVTQTPAASLLSRKFNATIIPIFVTSEDHKHHTVTFYDPIKPIHSDNMEDDIQKLSQAQTDILQSVIKLRPDEWFWSHKRFKVYDMDIYR
jgi:KDO2-lipid IV(A) lauroyltransferase